MNRKTSVEDWASSDVNSLPDGSWETMMKRVANFHQKHSFGNAEHNGHDLGYRIALTVEELGELSAAITKGKPKSEASEELADLLILILGHALARNVDLDAELHKNMDQVIWLFYTSPSPRDGT